VPNIYDAKASDFKKATERVYHSPSAGSRIMVNVMGGEPSAARTGGGSK
jgi:hypothetical protein